MKNNLTLSFALVASLGLAACQSTTSSIQDPNYRTKNGAATGAIAGALIGGMFAKDPYVTVTNMGSYLLVNLPDDVLFASGSATLQPALQGEISSIAANLVTYPKSTIEVVGHTDSVGSEAMNMDLSQRRAYSVANILIGSGVPAGRVSAYGLGMTQPVDTNATDAGRAHNRRVEILVRPTN